ncbi:MAG: response regulator transcription factor [Acidobacteria bacterium]|nr:response regulator transcription factor [Acidobacteriota bacterium]
MTHRARIGIVIADDHALVREGLRAVIGRQSDMHVVGVAGSGDEAVQECREKRPDVLLVDVSMPGMSGHDVAAAVKSISAATRIVVLTIHDEEEDIYRALRAGADGYVVKSAPTDELLAAIRTVHAGKRFISPLAAASLAGRITSDSLSARELQVLSHIAEGESNKQIATALRVAPRTIKGHLDNIFHKLSVSDRTRALVVAVRRGLIRLK